MLTLKNKVENKCFHFKQLKEKLNTKEIIKSVTETNEI